MPASGAALVADFCDRCAVVLAVDACVRAASEAADAACQRSALPRKGAPGIRTAPSCGSSTSTKNARATNCGSTSASLMLARYDHARPAFRSEEHTSELQ